MVAYRARGKEIPGARASLTFLVTLIINKEFRLFILLSKSKWSLLTQSTLWTTQVLYGTSLPGLWAVPGINVGPGWVWEEKEVVWETSDCLHPTAGAPSCFRVHGYLCTSWCSKKSTSLLPACGKQPNEKVWGPLSQGLQCWKVFRVSAPWRTQQSPTA